MGLYEEPRALLRAVPGLELVEMCRIKEYAWCCGAGGGVAEAYPDFNAFTAAERVAEAEATGAQALVTACGWCERNFNDAIAAIKTKGLIGEKYIEITPGGSDSVIASEGKIQETQPPFDIERAISKFLFGKVSD